MSSNDKSKKSNSYNIAINYFQISKNFFFFFPSNFDLSRHEWLNEIQEEWKYKVHVLKVLKIDSFPRKNISSMPLSRPGYNFSSMGKSYDRMTRN